MRHPWRWILTYRLKAWTGTGVSLVAHTLLLIFLAIFAMAENSPKDSSRFVMIVPSTVTNDPIDLEIEISPMRVNELKVPSMELQQVGLANMLVAAEPNVSIESSKIEVASSFDDWRLFELEPAVANRLQRQLELREKGQQAAIERYRSSLGSKAGISSGESGGSGNQSLNSGGAQYFGSRAPGKKFVFVVDASGSMRKFENGIRWLTATQELLRSLNDLTTDTEFFVICFNDVEHPIFEHYPPTNEYLKNEGKTLTRVQEWVANFHPGGNTYPSRALQMALEMKPDAIFLLSDGEIRDNSIMMLRLLNQNGSYGKTRIPIHTILLMSDYGQVTLQTIANENEGRFRSVTYRDWLAAQMR